MKLVPLTIEFKALDHEKVKAAIEGMKLEISSAKIFSVAAGRYESMYMAPGNPLGENIKYCDDFKTLYEAWGAAKKFMNCDATQFLYIEHMRARTTLKGQDNAE